MNMFYGHYPMDTDVSDFVATAYQTELILRLATRPEMGWYARNIPELQPPTVQSSSRDLPAVLSRTKQRAGRSTYAKINKHT